MSVSLRIKDLCFDYGSVSLLKDINLELKKGDFLGILGPNGSGKSTLVKNILGILQAKSGMIEIFGKNLKDYSIKELSKLIGFVPQKSALLVPLLVLDVLLMGRYSSLKRSYANYDEKDISEVKELAKRLNIEQFLERNVLSLSGGEFQRVLLARALLKKPQILLLDEPTSALDLNYALELLSECENLLKERNISVVAILHDLNLASMFCSKIIFLKEGKLRYQGSVNELFKKEILKEIYDLNCEVFMQNGKPYVLPLKTCS